MSRWCRGIETGRDAKKAEAIKLETLGMQPKDIASTLAVLTDICVYVIMLLYFSQEVLV